MDTGRDEVTGARIAFIDAIRGIAALLVVLQHGLTRSGLEHGGRAGAATDLLNLGETGVLAFFFVSGFIIPFSLEKYGSVGRFWINRVFRIYPLYLAVYAVALCIYGPTLFDSLSKALPNILAHLFLAQAYVGQKDLVLGSWTLSVEAVWYLGFSVLFLLSLHKCCRVAIGIAVALSAAAGALSLAHIMRMPMGRVGLLVACLWGLILYRHFDGSLGRRGAAWTSAVLLVVTVADLTIGFWLRPDTGPQTASYRCVMLSWSLGAILFGVPYLTRSSAVWRHSFFSFIGRISYSVYLVHGLVFALLMRNHVNGPILILAAFAVTVGLASLTHKYIERPAIRFSHRLGRVRPASVPIRPPGASSRA